MIKVIEQLNVDDVLNYIDKKINLYQMQPYKLENTKFFMRELISIKEKVEALKCEK